MTGKSRRRTLSALGCVLAGLTALAACGSNTNSAAGGQGASGGNASQGAGSDTGLLGQIKKQGYITIGTSGNNAPTIYTTTDGKLIGLDASWAEIIAKSLGVKIKWQKLDFAGLMPGLNSNRFDLVMSGFFVRAEREAVVTYSVPYAEDSTVLLYPTSLSRSVSDPQSGIKGRSVCVVAGSSNGDTPVTKWGGYTEIQRYPGQAQAFQSLQQGRCQVMVTGRLLALYWIKTQGGAGYKVSNGVESAPIAVGMPKQGSASLQAAVDAAINSAKKAGECQKLAVQWTGSQFPAATCSTELPPGYPPQP